jgi:hypothetical protein
MATKFKSVIDTPNDNNELYDQWITMWTNKILRAFDVDYDAYMISILFHPLGGSHQAKLVQMHRGTERLYNRLATRTVRKPRSLDKFDLPTAVFVPDYPVPKSDEKKSKIADVSINDGLHLGGLIIANRDGRIKTSLKTHFDNNKRTYLRDGIRSIGIDAITHDVWTVVDYTFKSLERRRFSFDDVRVHNWRDEDSRFIRRCVEVMNA